MKNVKSVTHWKSVKKRLDKERRSVRGLRRIWTEGAVQEGKREERRKRYDEGRVQTGVGSEDGEKEEG